MTRCVYITHQDEYPLACLPAIRDFPSNSMSRNIRFTELQKYVLGKTKYHTMCKCVLTRGNVLYPYDMTPF